MAASDYTITIKNGSNQQQTFLLFQNLPSPSNVPAADVYTNVYQNSGPIVNGPQSNVGFKIKKEYFAIYGTGVSNGDGTVMVTTADSRSVALGPNGTYKAMTTFDDKASPKWDEAFAAGKKTDTPGAFTIKTDSTFTYPNPKKIFLGCGAKSPNGDVVPIQTWPAKGGQTVVIYPTVKFFISTGELLPGLGAKANSLGDVLSIDFTTATVKNVTFAYDSTGAYKPVGDDPSLYGIEWSFGAAT